MIFDISFKFVFVGPKFKFRLEVIPYFDTLVKYAICRNSNLKKVDIRDWELRPILSYIVNIIVNIVIIGVTFTYYDEFMLI